jgi:hypothetical protein
LAVAKFGSLHHLGSALKKKSKTVITIETKEMWVISGSLNRVPEWCDQCLNQTVMLTADEAGNLTNVGTRKIYQWVEQGSVHFNELQDGRVVVCSASLRALTD